MEILWQKTKILTYPFTSFYSFKNPNCKLKDYDDKVLFNEIGEFNDRLDKIKLLKYSIYDNEENTKEWILKTLITLSEYFLSIRNNKLYIDENEKYEEYKFFNMYLAEGKIAKKNLWHYLKRISSEDLFKSCYVNDNINLNNAEIRISNSSIITMDPLLENILQNGISETHMHAGAGRSFIFLWNDVMNFKLNEKEKISINTYLGEKNLYPYLVVTRLVRLILATYLEKRRPSQKNIESFLRDLRNSGLKKIMNDFRSGEIEDNDFNYGEILSLIEEIITRFELETTDLYSSDNLEQQVLKNDKISKVFKEFYSISGEDKWVSKFSKENEIIFPENILLLKAFKYIKAEKDSFFEDIFIQYIRIKNIFYQYIIQQDSSGKGLDIFKPIYGRQSVLNKRDAFSEVFYTHFSSQNIKKMEIRISPDKEGKIEKKLKIILSEYLRLIESEKYSETNYPLIGIIYHFIKGKSKSKNCHYLYENNFGDKFLYYGDIKKKNNELARAILNLLNKIPEIGNYIVGIDAASGENDSEPHVFKEIFEEFRKPKNMFDNSYNQTQLSHSLGFTYHVGEDFRDIISGLRHIDEVVEHYEFLPGDRIGHGIVLGIDIDKWRDLNNVIFLPINEYLDNLLWEWGIYNNYEELKNHENLSYLENLIYKTAEKILGYTDGITIRDLYDLYLSKFKYEIEYSSQNQDCISIHTEKKFNLQNKCEHKCFEDSKWDRSKLRKALNCKYFVKEMEKNVSIEVNETRLEKYRYLQNFIKEKLSSKGIIIEVNPTSNVLIGDFKSYKDFGVENLSNPHKEEVIITVNTDDPIVFNTTLSNEYALLMEFMLKKKKYSRKEILDWLNKLRENGNNFSFIKDRLITKSDIKKELEKIINLL